MSDSVIGRISFSRGFSDGFETQNRLLLSAVYNINIPTVNANATSSINALVLPQNLSAIYTEIPAVIINGIGTKPNIDNLFGIFNLQQTQTNAFANINVDVLSASYNVQAAVVKTNANIITNIISSVFDISDVNIISERGYTSLPNSLSASYNLNAVLISSDVNNEIDILTAFYKIGDIELSIGASIECNTLSASFNLLQSSLVISANVNADELSLIYDFPIIKAGGISNYTFSANVISGAYNLNNSEVIVVIPEWFNWPQVPFNNYWRDDTECKDNERDLYENLLTDTYNKFASVWVYYPTTYNLTYDRVFKEDQNKFVIRGFSAMGFIEDIPAEHKSYRLEGIMGMDIFRAYFSIDHFIEASTYSASTPNIYEEYTPAVGDICYLTPNNVFYEVINVKTTVEQFLNREHNYELTLRMFRDNKMTVSANSPTLPYTDPIYTVCTSALSATEQFHDYLAINSEVTQLFSAVKYNSEPGEKSSNTFGGW